MALSIERLLKHVEHTAPKEKTVTDAQKKFSNRLNCCVCQAAAFGPQEAAA